MSNIEKVARAICEADNHAWPADDYNGGFQRRAFIKQAVAAIAAMHDAMTPYYMHTLDGQPAVFDGYQISLMVRQPRNVLAMSLGQIKRERRLSQRWRKSMGFSNKLSYGHFPVSPPAPEAKT